LLASRPRLQTIRDRIRAELEKRKNHAFNRFSKYSDNPVGFVEEVLLGTYWSKQKAIAKAVYRDKRVAVPSCHDVGKSFTAATLACSWLSCFPPGEAFVVTLAPTGHQVKAILWREINRIHKAAGLPGYVTSTEWKTAKTQGELIGYGRSPQDGTAIQGIHQKFVLVILDEACGIVKELFDAADTLIANEHSAILAIGNPDDPSSEFASVCKPGSGWTVIPISAFESPNFTGEAIPDYLKDLLVSKQWVEGREKKWGKDSAIYKAKVLGQFSEQSIDGLVSLADINRALLRTLPAEGENELGVDVARFGDNYTVIYHRIGPVFRLQNKFQGRDLMAVVGAIVQAVRVTGATRIKLDDTGLGGGVTDRLQEIKRNKEADGVLEEVSIIPVNVGESPTVIPDEEHPEKREKFRETEKFFNLKAQVNWRMRERFRMGNIDLSVPNIDLDERFDDLAAQAGDIKYRLTSKGYIQIESKEDMVKRGRTSPDDWDALVLCGAEGLTDPYLEIWAKLGRD
jgi:hypothetical protein